MNTRYAAVFGVQSRQNYLASNNRLRQTIGASKLIDKAMDWWREHCPLKVLYVGGGVAAVEFESREEAEHWAEKWSRYWLEKAPGLRLVAGWAPQTESLGKAWQTARTESFFQNEELSLFGDELGALPVTETCPDTGLAASLHDTRDGSRWLSAEAISKEDVHAQYRWELENGTGGEKTNRYFRALRNEFQFPRELEHLGQMQGARHIAIVHCDGNGMGKLFEDWDQHPTDDDFRNWIRETANKTTESAFASVLQTLAALIDNLNKLEGVVEPVCAGHGRRYLPLRPIVDSGDDVTWISHGKLGIWLAVQFCAAFQRLMGKTACAGVVIMPVGFPFARGMELATALCGQAKKERRKPIYPDRSWIDFHLVTEGSSSDIEEIRKERYRDGLLGRPYHCSPDDNRSFAKFHEQWRYFAKGEKWKNARSRAKALLGALEQGTSQTKALLELYSTQKYTVDWGNDETRIFDALELLDFHVDLPLPESVGGKNA